MARVTFVDAIDTVRGALDEVKDGQAKIYLGMRMEVV